MSPSPKEEESSEKSTTVIVHGKKLPLNPFVDKLFQSLVLTMVASLRAPELKGTEKVHIEITD